jgi:phosphate/sulfate permease
MAEPSGMKKLCELYVRRADVAGIIYCTVPTLAWFLLMFVTWPFREVYLLRLALALVVGGAVAAVVNRFGAALWVAKHRSPVGPATVLDGALVGAGCGWGTALVPPLTGLIATNHPMDARNFIIGSWLAAAVLGGVVGAILAAIGRKHLDRSAPAANEDRK